MLDLMALYAERKNDWFEWYWNNATDIEKRLYDLFSEYSEEYFADFRFETGTIVADFISVDIADKNDEDWGTTSLDPPEILQWFGEIVLNTFRYKVEPLDKNVLGEVDTANLTVTIPPIMLNDENGKPDILHEIIHMYELALDSLPKFYHDILVLSLYKKLREKISDLDNRIVMHTHIFMGNQITVSGGEHDILFLLKSFDLDLQCGYKLGTVCGYGRDTY